MLKMVRRFGFICLFFLCGALSSPIDEELPQFSPQELAEPEYLDWLLKEERYDEYNELMGIDVPHLSHPRSSDSTSDPMFNEGLFLGDILLTPQQKEQARQGIRFDIFPDSKWKWMYVPYVISSQYNSSHVNMINAAILNWNTNFGLCIRYQPRLLETAYVMFTPGNGCFSTAGRTGRQQTISISPNGCMVMGIINHEMEHTIGFFHEQNRWDRDEYIRIIPENIPPEYQNQYTELLEDQVGLQGPYDYYSIMHYPIRAPQTGKPAFEILKPGVNKDRVGQRVDFTDIDKQKIRKLYSCIL